MAEVAHAIRDRPTWERITAQARQEVALNPRYSFKAMVETVDDALDLAVTAPKAVDPIAFEGTASRSFARLDAVHLRARRPPAPIDRVRVVARRTVRGLMPSQRVNVDRLRDLVRLTTTLAYWTLRPRLLPWTLLARDRRLARELSVLGRLQALGARAIGAGRGSPYVILLDESSRDLTVSLRPSVTASAVPLGGLPGDLSWVSSVHLDVADRWLVAPGTPIGQAQPLDALSRVVRGRPEVVHRLLAGPAPWCDVLLKSASVPAAPIGKAERP